MSDEYLLPSPGSTQKGLLDFKAEFTEAGSVEFSEDEATMDVMGALDRVAQGLQRPKGEYGIGSERSLARRWGWPKTRVHERLPDLVEQAHRWRRFNRPADEPEDGSAGSDSDHSPTTSDHPPTTLRPKSSENEPESAISDHFSGPSDHSPTTSDHPPLYIPRARSDTDIRILSPAPAGARVREAAEGGGQDPELHQHPAVLAFREAFPGQRLQLVQREQIVVAVGDGPGRVEVWRGETLERWRMNGYSPRNLFDLLDRFKTDLAEHEHKNERTTGPTTGPTSGREVPGGSHGDGAPRRRGGGARGEPAEAHTFDGARQIAERAKEQYRRRFGGQAGGDAPGAGEGSDGGD